MLIDTISALAISTDVFSFSALLDMAKKIKAEQRKSIQTQCARPTFALPSSSAIKRKLDFEDDDDTGSVKKGKS